MYSNSLSGISDLASNYANPGYAMPDVIYDALWNGAANTLDPVVPATDWAQHQRIHQYLGALTVLARPGRASVGDPAAARAYLVTSG